GSRHPGACCLQVGGGVSGMTCDAEQTAACRVEAALELKAEQQIGKLALPIGQPLAVALLPVQIVEANAAQAMRPAADRNHSCARGRLDEIKKQTGKTEMTEMIGAELHLESVDGAAIGQRHHARVVAEDIQTLMPLMKRLRERADRGEARQVEFHHFDR